MPEQLLLVLSAVLFCCGFFCLAQSRAQFNGCPPGFCNPPVVTSGGSAPTFSAVTAVSKSGCGGGFTCTDTVIIGAGFAVVGFQASGTGSAVSLCGTPLFQVVNTGNATDSEMSAGTTTGCGTANDISFTTNSGFGNMTYAVGLITGLSGSYSSGIPADHTCAGNYPGTQGAPYPCSSSLTVNASGIAVGIGVAGNDFGSGVTACSPGSCDITVSPATGGFASGIWHWTSTGQTPSFTANNNDTAGMLAASWH
jgi:hypothetical protein